MRTNMSRWLAFAGLLMVGLCLFQMASSPARAQCAATIVTFGPQTDYIYIVKSVPDATYCRLSAFDGRVDCFPGGNYPPFIGATRAGGTLSATHRQPYGNPPYCRWTCRCPAGPTTITVTTDGSDGLPIELMGFTVE